MITFVLGWLAGWAAVAAMLWYRRTFATLRSVTWLEDGSGLATWGRRRLFVSATEHTDVGGLYVTRLLPRCRWHDSGAICPNRVHWAVHHARKRDEFNERLLAA